MSDIALLMTSVLTTGQPSRLILPEQPLVQLDNGLEKSIRGQLSQLVTTAQATPPEFIQPDGKILATPSVPTTQRSTGVQVSPKSIGEYSLQTVSFQACSQKLHQKYTKSLLNLAAQRENIVRSYPHTNSLSPLNQSANLENNATESFYLLQQEIGLKIADTSHITDEQDGENKMSVTKSQQLTDPFLPPLQFGDSGTSVRVLQRLLVFNGYRTLEVDGVFGALTEVAVKSFQIRRNLMVDGIVGQRTWYELTK